MRKFNVYDYVKIIGNRWNGKDGIIDEIREDNDHPYSLYIRNTGRMRWFSPEELALIECGE